MRMGNSLKNNIRVELAHGTLKRQATQMVHDHHYLHSSGATQYTFAVMAQQKNEHGLVEWEQLIGCALYGCGLNPNSGGLFGLKNQDVVELLRLFILDDAKRFLNSTHIGSYVLGQTLSYLTKHTPHHVALSYTDPEQDHVGTVYQASNWTCIGQTNPDYEVVVNGVVFQQRTLYSYFSTAGINKMKRMVLLDPDLHIERKPLPPKYRYAYVVSSERYMAKRLQQQLEKMKINNPKKESESNAEAA
jgi:hypothetical protein